MDGAGFNQRKLEELILYVALRSEDSPTYGRTKLVKLLFFSDFAAFKRLGRPITGSHYRKLEFGPCPAEFPEATRALEKSGRAIYREPSKFSAYGQRRLIALRDPDLSVFTAEEIAIVDEIVERFKDRGGGDLSDLSHEFAGWRLAEPGEEIPYETVVLHNAAADLSPAEMSWAKATVKKLLGP
jgi:hypothetical protein